MLKLSGTLRHLLRDSKVPLLFLVWRLPHTGWLEFPDLALWLNLSLFFLGLIQISSIGHGCDAFVRRALKNFFQFLLFFNLFDLFELEGALLFGNGGQLCLFLALTYLLFDYIFA